MEVYLELKENIIVGMGSSMFTGKSMISTGYPPKKAPFCFAAHMEAR